MSNEIFGNIFYDFCYYEFCFVVIVKFFEGLFCFFFCFYKKYFFIFMVLCCFYYIRECIIIMGYVLRIWCFYFGDFGFGVKFVVNVGIDSVFFGGKILERKVYN